MTAMFTTQVCSDVSDGLRDLDDSDVRGDRVGLEDYFYLISIMSLMKATPFAPNCPNEADIYRFTMLFRPQI